MMKDVMSNMSSSEMEQVSEMTKGQGSEITENINSMIEQQKVKAEQVEKDKPKINIDTLFVPATEMTAEDIAAEKQRRSQVTRRKKRPFSHIQITVPKITELNRTQEASKAIAVPKPAKSTVESTPSQANIDSLFSFESKAPPKQFASLASRLAKIKAFQPAKQASKFQAAVLEAGETTLFRIITAVKCLPTPASLPVPHSTQEFDEEPKAQAGKYLVTKTEQGWERTLDCIGECQDLAKKFDKVVQWLNTLVGRQVPQDWLCQELEATGLFLHTETEASLEFHMYGRERTLRESTSVFVPEIPFVLLKLL
jgi:hypothetical protein